MQKKDEIARQKAVLAERRARLSETQRASLEKRLSSPLANTPQTIIPIRSPQQPAVLSFAQQRLWFLDQLEPDSPFYNTPAAVRLPGPLDVAALERSLNTIVQRHETLRTTFQTKDGQPIQIIAPALRLTLPIVDLSGMPDVDREAQMRRLTVEEARRPFDLARGPLVRITLLRLAAEDHILLVTLHHIISDGWSIGVFNGEVAALYFAFSIGGRSPLGELPVQYADYAVWQREWLRGEVLDRQLAYWKQQLAGAPASLDLPADRRRPAVPTYRGAAYTFNLPLALTTALKELSRRENVTLFMTLLAGFDVLLARYTGQTDIVVGTPIANRTQVELEGLIGFFANTLVLRTDVSGDPTVRELLSRVREVTLGAYGYQDVPFEMLVEALQPERDLSRNPLFQVMFAFQNAPLPVPRASGAALTPVSFDTGTSRFDLLLSVQDTGQGLAVTVEYSTELFDGRTIERMMRHYAALLGGMVEGETRRVSAIELLTADERREVVETWNATAVRYGGSESLHELVAEQAARTLEAVAVVSGDEQHVTYAELNRRGERLADYLAGMGVGPETPVGVCLERSVEMVVGVLGVLKAGGVYVPLDPAYPAERLGYGLRDSQAAVVLSQASLRERVAEQTSACVVSLDTDWERVEAARRGHRPAVSGEQLAYIIYTSGSTGRPKGVTMRHGPLVNLMHWQAEATRLSGGRRTLQYAPLSFDVSCQEIFHTWSSGGTLVLVSEETRRDGVELARWMERQAVERLFVPFVGLQQLGQALEGAAEVELRSLREVVTAGEQLQVTPQVAGLMKRLRGGVLHNQYGPTEGHVVTAHTLAGEVEGWPGLPPIGRPIANVALYVLDEGLKPVPVGVVGELYIGGGALARGYLNRPDLTAVSICGHTDPLIAAA